ncbi:hypothetical protein RGAI101_2655 [Roseobacter sp. GAI101]|nr:hypothetical protein RGAI101_2655 [Roseobacter sp. GAI101]
MPLPQRKPKGFATDTGRVRSPLDDVQAAGN